MTDLNTVKIVYIGKGIGYLPGVPARTMTNDEARVFGIPRLLRSGLYKIERPKRTRAPKQEDGAKKDGD